MIGEVVSVLIVAAFVAATDLRWPVPGATPALALHLSAGLVTVAGLLLILLLASAAR